MFKKVFLSYNSDGLQDGYFSQLQRQMAIYSLAKQFGFSYHHTEISNVTITPLDPYQTIRVAKNFIIKNNNIYNFGKNTENIAFSKTIEIHTPTLFQILWVGIKSIFPDEKVKIKIVIPYRIIERTPKSYSYIVNHLSKNLNQPTGKINKIKFVIHARKGVIESHITPGENSPRALKTEYYIAVLKHIFKTNMKL